MLVIKNVDLHETFFETVEKDHLRAHSLYIRKYYKNVQCPK